MTALRCPISASQRNQYISHQHKRYISPDILFPFSYPDNFPPSLGTSGKCLNSIAEEDQFYALDYRRDGSVFAASGKNHTVRIYDETTKHEVMILQGGTGYGTSSTPGHSNRVFALRFHHDDPEVLLTGGWDNTVQFWDMRVRHSVRSIFGPHLSGDALDVCGNQVLTGSWRPKDPLEIWDYGTGQLVETVPWNRSGSQA
ncbi:unnamed protein product, partial [Discosporangium mesarthrocarpum]